MQNKKSEQENSNNSFNNDCCDNSRNFTDKS